MSRKGLLVRLHSLKKSELRAVLLCRNADRECTKQTPSLSEKTYTSVKIMLDLSTGNTTELARSSLGLIHQGITHFWGKVNSADELWKWRWPTICLAGWSSCGRYWHNVLFDLSIDEPFGDWTLLSHPNTCLSCAFSSPVSFRVVHSYKSDTRRYILPDYAWLGRFWSHYRS